MCIIMLYRIESHNSVLLKPILKHRYSSVYATYYLENNEYTKGSAVLDTIVEKFTEYLMCIGDWDNSEIAWCSYKPRVRLHVAFVDHDIGTTTIGPMIVNYDRIYEAVGIMIDEGSLLQRKESFLEGQGSVLLLCLQ